MNCIPKPIAKILLDKLASGEFDMTYFIGKNTQQIKEYLEKFFDKKTTAELTPLVQQKLVLKNQQMGLMRLFTRLTENPGMMAYMNMKPAAKKDIISKINRMSNILTPETEDAFFEELAERKLGLHVTAEQAKNIAMLAKNAETLRDERDKILDPDKAIDLYLQKKLPADYEKARMDYGRAAIAFQNYNTDIHDQADRLPVKEYLKPKNWGQVGLNVGGAMRTLKASLDVSGVFRQSWRTWFRNPAVAMRNTLRMFRGIGQEIKGKDMMNEINADIVSRPTYSLMMQGKLAVQTLEEAFPNTFIERLPILGVPFKISDHAYTAITHMNRADMFDYLVKIARNQGVDLNNNKKDNQVTEIARLANALTGRGGKSATSPNSATSQLFFSKRLLQSHIDTLLMPMTAQNSFTKKQAARNLLQSVGGMAALLIMASIFGAKVEKDPRSTDFGKVRVGNTTFDTTGGMGSVVVLASRLAAGILGQPAIKNSKTGLFRNINTREFGAKDGLDLLYDFLENKLAPGPALAKVLLTNRTYAGAKPTVKSVALDAITPLIVSNVYESITDPEAADAVVVLILEALGINTQTYRQGANWQSSSSEQLQAFKKRVDKKTFLEANDLENSRFDKWFEKRQEQRSYQIKTDEQKANELRARRQYIRKTVLAKYGFHYN